MSIIDRSHSDASRKPIRPRAFLTVSDLPGLMSRPSVRGADRPLIQFVMDWRWRTKDRMNMVADPPPPDTDEVTAAKIAAVVHALCDRDGFKIPAWVGEHRLTHDVALFDVRMDSPYGQWVRQQAPAVCAQHRVYFEADMLNA